MGQDTDKKKIKCGKICIIRLVHIQKKNLRQLFDKYSVARTKQDALVKSTMKTTL